VPAGGGSGGDVALHLGGTRTALYVTTGRPPGRPRSATLAEGELFDLQDPMPAAYF
jgi:hypothetical protein